ALADEVMEGDTMHFDQWAIRALRDRNRPEQPIGPIWLPEVARDITALGGVAVLTLVTAAVAGYLLIERKYRAMMFVIVAAVGALLVSNGLTHCFDRDRPQPV